jgi:hypothetical protein
VTDRTAQIEGAARPRRPLVSGSVNEPTRADLIEEAGRYLATVEFFRVEDCEPHWRREPLHGGVVAIDAAVTRHDAASVR